MHNNHHSSKNKSSTTILKKEETNLSKYLSYKNFKVINNSNKRNKFHSLNISLKNSLKKISPDKTLLSQKSTIAINNKNEECLKKLTKDKKALEKQLSEEKKRVKDLENKVKRLENEKTQLIIVLKLVENTGVDIEAIVDEWNKEVQMQGLQHKDSNSSNGTYVLHKKKKNNTKKKNMNYSFTNTISYDNDNNVTSKEHHNSVLNSSNFLPLNIDDPNSQTLLKNNYTYNNIPKLNFDKIKMSQQKCKYNITGTDKHNINNNNKNNKVKVYNDYFSKDKNEDQIEINNKRKFNSISSNNNNDINKRLKKDKQSSSTQCLFILNDS